MRRNTLCLSLVLALVFGFTATANAQGVGIEIVDTGFICPGDHVTGETKASTWHSAWHNGRIA